MSKDFCQWVYLLSLPLSKITNIKKGWDFFLEQHMKDFIKYIWRRNCNMFHLRSKEIQSTQLYWTVSEKESVSATTDQIQNKYRMTQIKFLISNGCNSETNHLWPYVGKAKMRLRGGSFFFNFQKIVYIFQLFVYNFSKKKLRPLKHILALPTWGQKCLVLEV